MLKTPRDPEELWARKNDSIPPDRLLVTDGLHDLPHLHRIA
jgi:hypothetical protein